MKRGIQPQENTFTFYALPEDIFPLIFSKIPAYQFIGSDTISTVSKQWKIFIEANKFFDKKTYQELIKSCLQDPEGVRYILSDEFICQHLSRIQFLHISGCNQEIALHIINTPELCATLDGYDLRVLGDHHLGILGHIFDILELRTKLFNFQHKRRELGDAWIKEKLAETLGNCSFVNAVCEYAKALNKENEVKEMDIEQNQPAKPERRKCVGG